MSYHAHEVVVEEEVDDEAHEEAEHNRNAGLVDKAKLAVLEPGRHVDVDADSSQPAKDDVPVPLLRAHWNVRYKQRRLLINLSRESKCKCVIDVDALLAMDEACRAQLTFA